MAQGWRGSYYRYREFFLNILELYKKKQDLRMFLEVILSLTTVAIFLLFALKPTAVTIINLLKEIDEKKETVARLDEKLRNLGAAQNVYASETDSIPIIESSVPNFPEPSIFVGQIQAFASENSVGILGISIGEVVLVGKADVKKTLASKDLKALPAPSLEMPISISVNGTYPNLLAFLIDLENARRPLKMDIIGINSSATETGQIVTLIISGRIPFLGE